MSDNADRSPTGDSGGPASSGDTGARVVLCTAPDAEVGETLADHLVRRRLAACVNLLPGLRSVYWWDGDVQSDAEVLLLIKSDVDHLEALIAAVRERHPYDCPEALALPVTEGLQEYLDWLGGSLES